jgi:hypothetical protein
LPRCNGGSQVPRAAEPGPQNRDKNLGADSSSHSLPPQSVLTKQKSEMKRKWLVYSKVRFSSLTSADVHLNHGRSKLQSDHLVGALRLELKPAFIVQEACSPSASDGFRSRRGVPKLRSTSGRASSHDHHTWDSPWSQVEPFASLMQMAGESGPAG